MRIRTQDYALAAFLTGCLLIALGLLLAGTPALAQEATGEAVEATAEPPAAAVTEAADEADAGGDALPAMTGDEVVDNAYCLVCHASTDRRIAFEDGALPVEVDPDVIAHSVHGVNADEPVGCTDCHGEKRYPHTDPLPATVRQYEIQQSALCAKCHEEQTGELVDSVHYSALAAGNERAATCTDCHGAHNVEPPDEPRQRIAATCGSCHAAVFEEFSRSVHGESLEAGDPNVPACVDCHGVHGIEHPTTALFRNRSPELCASCHANEAMMAEYDITTNVFNSYLTDFHGTTVALFEQQDPNVPTNKAVCFDCHGVHDIRRVDETTSRVVRENLLDTCQRCHPQATSNFPASWVGHFPPTFESHPLMFAVDLFYKILIPLVLAGFVFLVLTDIIRRLRRGGHHEAEG